MFYLHQWLTANSQYDACIRYHINGYHLRQYLQDKNGWSDSVWTEIDFATFGNHFRRMTPSNQVLHMKVVHNQLPLGDRRLRQSPVLEESTRIFWLRDTGNEVVLNRWQE